MSKIANGNRDHLFQLMADQATEGLGESELQVLRNLLSEHPDVDALEFELAAAAADLAMITDELIEMPDRLRDRILTEAGRFVGATTASVSNRRFELAGNGKVQQFKLRRRSVWSAYFVASAALAAALVGWWQVAALYRAESHSPTVQYASFVREAGDVVRVPWVGQEKDYKGVSGEAWWSQSRQKGFMRFVGLTPNDPARKQYQLWIVDPSRDKHPIDGGVFDVGTAGEVIVPIDAKLMVDHPAVFAITLEKPGGVVVSDGPLLVIGALPG